MSNIVKAVARIEQNHKLSGSQEGRKLENFKIAYDGKGREAEINAQTFVSPLAYKFTISLTEKNVTLDMIQRMDPDLRITKGLFMLKYVPKTNSDYKKGRPWKMGQDIIRMGIRLSGPKHWHMLCNRIPELKWIERNSTLTDELFGLCAQHPGMTFWFSVDWVRYAKMLEDKRAAELESVQGKEPDTEEAVFAARKCSFAEWEDKYKDKCAKLRYLSDVLKEVQEVESSPTVQREMLAETGESAVTREFNNQPKDPITGQFISKKKKED